MNTTNANEFPDAVVTKDAAVHRWLSRSVNWLLLFALLGLLIAAGVAWMASAPDGTEISVHFRDGYGLKPEDAVRYRGISIGEVVDVRLADDLKGVVVDAILFPSAEALAREGSAFWVERPQVSLAGVRSLDTLVGGRYMSVLPGPPGGAEVTDFVGDEEPPAILDPVEGGLPITLVAEERFGLERGSPLTYRGLTAGQVLQVGLAPSGHAIRAQAVIFPEYRELVRDNTLFWSRNGVDVKIGLRGVDMDLDPATALSSGAIAFATPLPAGERIQAGAQFELSENEADGWQDWEPFVDLSEALMKRRRENVESGEAPKRPFFERLRKAVE